MNTFVKLRNFLKVINNRYNHIYPMCKDLDQLNMFGYLKGLHYRAKGQSIKFTLSACTSLKVPDIIYTVKAYHPNIIQSLQHDCDSHLPDDT